MRNNVSILLHVTFDIIKLLHEILLLDFTSQIISNNITTWYLIIRLLYTYIILKIAIQRLTSIQTIIQEKPFFNSIEIFNRNYRVIRLSKFSKAFRMYTSKIDFTNNFLYLQHNASHPWGWNRARFPTRTSLRAPASIAETSGRIAHGEWITDSFTQHIIHKSNAIQIRKFDHISFATDR